MPALKEMMSAVVLLRPAHCIPVFELVGKTLVEMLELQPSPELTPDA